MGDKASKQSRRELTMTKPAQDQYVMSVKSKGISPVETATRQARGLANTFLLGLALTILTACSTPRTHFDPLTLSDKDEIGIVPLCSQRVGYTSADSFSCLVGREMISKPRTVLTEEDIEAFCQKVEHALGKRVKRIGKDEIVLTADGKYRDDMATAQKAGVAAIMYFGFNLSVLHADAYFLTVYGRMIRVGDGVELWYDTARADTIAGSVPKPICRESIELWVRQQWPDCSERLAHTLTSQP